MENKNETKVENTIRDEKEATTNDVLLEEMRKLLHDNRKIMEENKKLIETLSRRSEGAEVLEEEETEVPNRVLPTTTAKRRESFMVVQDRNPPVTAPLRAVPQVLHVQQSVPEEMKISTISLRALRVVIDNQRRFASTYNQEMNIGHFLRPTVLRALVEEEHRRGTALSRFLNHANILAQDDVVLTGIIMGYIRRNYAHTFDAFRKTLMDSVDELTAATPGWIFQAARYHKELHANAAKLIRDLEMSVEHLYDGATSAEMDSWPKRMLGTEKEYGLWRIILMTFGIYEKNFEFIIGTTTLRLITEAAELFKQLRAVNNNYADEGLRHENFLAKSSPPTPMDTVRKEFTTRAKAQEEMRRGIRVGMQDKRQLDAGYSRGNPTQILQRPSTPVVTRPGQADAGRPAYAGQAIGRPAVRNYQIFPEEEHTMEQSYMSEQSDVGLDRLLGNADSDESRTEEEGPYEEEGGTLAGIMARHGEKSPPGTKSLFDPNVKKSIPSLDKPCYNHFWEGNCKGNCGWGHAPQQFHEFKYQQWKRLLNSPYVKLEWLEEEIAMLRRAANAQKQAGPRHAMVERVESTGEAGGGPATAVGGLKTSGLDRHAVGSKMVTIDEGMLDTDTVRVLSGGPGQHSSYQDY